MQVGRNLTGPVKLTFIFAASVYVAFCVACVPNKCCKCSAELIGGFGQKNVGGAQTHSSYHF